MAENNYLKIKNNQNLTKEIDRNDFPTRINN